MQIQASRPAPTGLHAGAPRTTVSDVGEIFGLILTEMGLAEEQLHAQLMQTIPAVSEIGRYLALAGGKRLRPLLTGLGARAVGFEGSIGELMCIGELLHLGSLLHDDVVDDGRERRGKAAAQRVYGNPAVILTGDFCVSRALWLASVHGGHEAVTRLSLTVAAMSEGEVTQLLNAGNPNLEVETYLEIVDKKSASLISWCVAAGAWAVDDKEAANALMAFGSAVGIAFQIADDVLDYTGDKLDTGKRRGKDLAERKMTLPLLLAMEEVDGLREELLAGDPVSARVPVLLQQVLDSGATDAALVDARTRVEAGIRALHTLAPSPYRDALESLAHHLVDRIA